MTLVQPRLFRGVRDILPEQALARHHMVETVREVYERYGFVPLDTPAIEYMDVLTGSAGGEAEQAIFEVVGAGAGRATLGLRFDLTVPLARVTAQYRELPRPFRRYQVASVWRADKPGPGRFREFTQFDLDSVGAESEVADTEIIAAMCDALSALKVEPYLVRFSSRKVLNLVIEYAGLESKMASDVFRVLDKVEKAGIEKVRLELTSGYTDESGDKIAGLGLKADQVNRIEEFLSIRSDRRSDVIEQLLDVVGAVPRAASEIDLLRTISDHLYALGYSDDRVAIDLSIARGLAYYTGPVFEATLLDAPQFGSVFGGGRYDDLVTRFLGERVPATGASMGVDRLLAALIHLERVPRRQATADVLVAMFDDALTGECLKIAQDLRVAGIPTELYLGEERSIGAQVKYADQWRIPLVVIFGADEKAKDVVTLKNMAVGQRLAGEISDRDTWRRERPGQEEVSLENLSEAVRILLEAEHDQG